MGRELKRIALDFNWPLNKVWKGYINPHFRACPESQKTCFNGCTAGEQWLESILRLLVTAADDALDGGRRKERGGVWPHPYLVEMPTVPTYDIPRELSREEVLREMLRRRRDPASFVLPLTKDLVDLVGGFEDRGPSPFGFLGGSATYRMREALLKAAKLDPETWGICPVCKGKNMDPAIKEQYDAWKGYEPTEGPDWQLWETVSEGSPISPVFPTRETFVEYLVSTGTTRSASEAFANSGWTPSAVNVPDKGFVSGIEVAEALGTK